MAPIHASSVKTCLPKFTPFLFLSRADSTDDFPALRMFKYMSYALY